MAFLPDKTGSVEGVGVAEPVGVTSVWLFCSESGDESRDEEEAVLSMEEELEGGGAVTVEEDPEDEEDEEIDLGRGSAEAEAEAGAGAGVVEASGATGSNSMGPSAPAGS